MIAHSLATSESTALGIDLSMCKVVLLLWINLLFMFRVYHAFLFIHAALWSPARKGPTSLVFYLFQQILPPEYGLQMYEVSLIYL